VSDIEDRLSRLEEQVSRSEDERGILATLYKYGHSIDYGLEADWVECFAEDGAFDMRRRPDFAPAEGQRHQGRKALAAFVATHTRAPARWHKHMVVEPVVTVDGDGATVTSYFLRMDEDEGGSDAYAFAFGRYRDRMVRCEDGVWRFQERVVEIESLHPR